MRRKIALLALLSYISLHSTALAQESYDQHQGTLSQESKLPSGSVTDINHPSVIYLQNHDLQEVIDAAPAHSIVFCNRNQQLTISTTVVIRKPLTLRGLNARLPDGLGKTSILEVESEYVTITDFTLRGNADTVAQEVRAPLIRIYNGNFRVERGVFENSSRDGVQVSPRARSSDIVGGVIRDIVGNGVVRDVVSLSGTSGDRNPQIRNVLIENIRGYDSSLRGTVEVSDGTDHITVRKIYAENCIYAIDLQDHNNKVEINRNIIINDVYALNCRHAIRSANHPFGHANLTMMSITAEQCQQPLQVSNTDRVTIQDVRIINHKGSGAAMTINNCDGLTIRDVIIMNSVSHGAGLLVRNCQNVMIDGVSLLQKTEGLSSGVRFSISRNRAFSNLRIHNVSAKNVQDAGVILESRSKNGTLTDYIISGNIAQVLDRIQGNNGLVINNISEAKQDSPSRRR
jgi:hypothetical protein